MLGLGSIPSPLQAADISFAPFKDKLYAYAPLISREDNGDFERYGFDELRDVNGRDWRPGFVAKRKYIHRIPGGHRDLQLTGDGPPVRYFAAGAKPERTKVTLVYIHGNGGNRKQGIDNRTFGGNFGRLQNLVVRAGGLYLSPGFSDFGAGGAQQITRLLRHHKNKAPSAPVILACGSQGSLLCWRLANSKSSAALIDGLVMLGGSPNGAFAKRMRAGASPIPLVLAHGTKDTIFPWQSLKAFYDRLRSRKGGYPVRMVLFETGVHGTPIRMIDWRNALNWLTKRT